MAGDDFIDGFIAAASNRRPFLGAEIDIIADRWN